MMELEEYTNLFLEFEEEYNMFDLMVGNIKIWNYFRQSCMWDVRGVVAGLPEEWAPFPTNEYQGKYNLKRIIEKYILRNYIYAGHRDVLIFSHARKVAEDENYYKDVYTNLIDYNLDISHYIVDRNLIDGSYILQKSSNILTDDITRFQRIANVKTKPYYPTKKELNEKIYSKIESYFDIKIDNSTKQKWAFRIQYYVQEKELAEKYYDFLINRIKPKAIMLVTHYDYYMQVLTETAKKRNIPVIELQHGLIGKLHGAYNYIRRRSIPTFPDYVFCFGEYDRYNTRWPIEINHVIPVGFPELEIESEKKTQRSKGNKKVVLFISGDEELMECAKELYDILDNSKFQIIYKCHPSEYSVWKKRIAPIFEQRDIEIIHSNDKSVYHYLNQADVVIGNNSTVLFEATLFDNTLAILKGKSSGFCEIIANVGLGTIISNAYELKNLIDNPISNNNDNYKGNYFFEKDSITNINIALKQIIKNSVR